MKQVALGFLLICFQFNGFSQLDSVLIKQLDSLVTEDQRWRGALRKIRNKEIDSIDSQTASIRMTETDNRHYFVLQSLVKKKGFLGFDLVGREGSHDFWLLVQHQDANPDFQKEVLQLMEVELVKYNDLKIDYAYLLDRVNVNTGEKQIYGTQLIINTDSTSFIPKPLIEPDKVNERRKEVMLQPIEGYIEFMNKRHYGSLNEKIE